MLIARDNSTPQINSFCFVCPEKAAKRYRKGLRKAVLDEGNRLGLELMIEAL